MSFPDGSSYEGTLHGTWEADSAISTSDRRLKSSIAPLHQTLISQMSRARGEVDASSDSAGSSAAGSAVGSSSGTGPKKKERKDAVEWVLRELRPVSFTFKQGIDSKTMQGKQRYGFVAQEVEKVVPSLIHDTGTTKSMLYQDLIAMITMAAQDHQERLQQHNGEVGKLRGLLKTLAEKLGHLQKRVVRVIGPYEPKAGLRATATPAQQWSK
jgi:hypothetical protein